ncbi:uncharacterized protein N0V89_005635 [Didymosphaeria variabile]|uniref:Fungal N-terminal domain-containing protein n=1 Tax=Didymosphaeria variabile TaxID=1932322 RepID=A0A9W9CBN6_9PLEO|nr:uncharacterized protein N0V89_005635 [Didymosphaeria variabile]KAJ4353904.1 hypothetical protein N0V89_005635 [Didymosphaeria variabile]
MTVPSIGDILLLSQTAWKVGRAFTAGRTHAPVEFQDVELEINALAKALKLLAEAFFADSDDSLLKQADARTQHGLATIVNSCSRAVHDLESLLDQYQVVKKTRNSGGFAVERSWSDMVLTQYKTMMWTTDGGNLQNLRYLLQMHANTITLTMRALQSKSITQLESVVNPIAEQVDSIQHRTRTLSQQLDEANRIVKDIASRSHFPPTPNTMASSPGTVPLQPSQISQDRYSATDFFPTRQSSKISRPQSPPPSFGSPELSAPSSPPRSTLPSPQATRKRISEFSVGGPGSRYSGSVASSEEDFSHESKTPLRYAYLSRQPSTKAPSFAKSVANREARSRPDSGVLSPMLPPPAMTLPPLPDTDAGAETASLMSGLSLGQQTQSARSEIKQLHRSSMTLVQKEQFEKVAFRNAAILCDVRGTTVEYAQKVSADEGSHDVEMVEACLECRIAVVRKREAMADAKHDIRMMTSIWVFSDDNTVRLELKMVDGEMYVPYSSYFSPEKVSVTVPCELKFHDVKYGQRVLRTAKTTWINYIFESAHSAALFQNELMGRTLLATYRTSKTLRIHEGLSGAFSYAEQMCGMENLRIWEDNDTLAVIALIHFSPQFRNGYLAFYLNSANTPIRVKDDGGREVKVKGLRVPLEGKGNGRKDSVIAEGKSRGEGVDKKKMVTGARIEFASEAEKRDFLGLVWEVQKEMRDLPGLAGVN